MSPERWTGTSPAGATIAVGPQFIVLLGATAPSAAAQPALVKAEPAEGIPDNS